MARSRDLDEGEEEIWGTWEELLLACAVGRHGTRRWDSVATEVQSRMTPSSALLLTPFRCRQRFNLLQLRFTTAVATDGGAGSRVEVLLIEELRKLRIAELRREVDRSDHSIVSLKLKLKSLKEDGERNLRESEPGGSDPETDQDPKPESPAGSTEEALAEDRVSKGSSKESNSTDPKGNGNAGKPEGVARNPECTAMVGKRETEPEERDQGLAEPQESGESAAELKPGDAEETSEGRTSSSHARQHRRRRRKVPLASSSGGGGAEEPEVDVVSHRTGTTSQPFIAFLEIIRASTSGSVFERRLESQESEEYRNLIRCHVDLEMISEKIQRLGAAYMRTDFFRDLLLLCNNAIVFYPMDSNESIAAVHLREQISKEMAATHHQASTQPPPPPPPPLPPVAEKIKADPHLSGPLFEKSESTIPLIVCRKRSSISAKKTDPDPKVKRKDKPGPEPVPEPDPNSKKKMKELPTPAPSRGLRTSKSRSLNRSRRSHTSSNLKAEMAEPEPEPEVKPERKNSSSAASSVSAKKRGGPANLLKRIKRTPADNEKVSPPSSAVCSDKAEGKKKGGKGNNGKTPKRVVKEPAPAKKVRELEAVKPSPAPRKRKRR